MNDRLSLPSPEQLYALWFDAARNGQDEAIPALLRAGIHIDAIDPKGYSALMLASYNGRESTTALLLAEGASVDAPGDGRGNTALIGVAFKGHEMIARRLIDEGADVDRRNGAGQTALMTAVLFGQSGIVDMLIAAGADRDLSDDAGNDARRLAMTQDNAAMLARLD